MRYLLLIAALMLGGYAWSNGPTPRPSIDGQISKANSTKSDKETADSQQGTEKNPLVVKRLDAEETAERRQQQAAEREEKSALERRMVFWTWILAVTTIILACIAGGQLEMFRRQLGLMRKATSEAGDAAKAANTSANATMLAERAYVKMSHVPPGVRWFEKNQELCQVEVEVKNFGRTPASVTDVKIWAKLLDNGNLLQEPFHYPHRDFTPNAFLVPNEAFFHQGHFPLRGQNLTDTKCGAKKLWIYGHVDYIDTFGVRYRGGYVRVYNHMVDDGKQNNLFYMPEAIYNYDRPREQGEGNDWA